MVGADGIHSAVRTELGPDKLKYTGMVSTAACRRISERLAGSRRVHQVVGRVPGKQIVVFPLTGGREVLYSRRCRKPNGQKKAGHYREIRPARRIYQFSPGRTGPARRFNRSYALNCTCVTRCRSTKARHTAG